VPLADERTVLDGIPLTTPARTLLDLAGDAHGRMLEGVLAAALRRGLVGEGALSKLLERHPTLRGTSRLRALMSSGQAPALTPSEAEERFLAAIRRAQLPAPETNVMVCGYEVDFYWRSAKLVAEIDGFEFHSSRKMFEADRRREGILAAAGVRVIRITWRQLEKEPEAVLVRLALALSSFRTS
jgi:very-short-patch-repair endonuclease